MPLAADTAGTADTPATSVLPRARSLRAARAVLLGAAAAGLVGLSLPGGSADGEVVSLSAASSAVVTFSDVLHAPVFAPPPPRVKPPRASRTRTVPPVVKKAPAAKKKVVSAARYVRPSYASVVSHYGPRWGRMHKGIDFGAGHGADIRAVADGVVIGAGYLSGESGYGQITLIRHKSGAVTAYAHQSKLFVHAGERVEAGEVIGLVGSTGRSTGPHLHFEVRIGGAQVNPLTWLRGHGVSI